MRSAVRRARRGGPEAAARTARYAALAERGHGGPGRRAVLLGHSRDDQAETVLLGLARGSGRQVAGRDAASAAGVYRRPLLGVGPGHAAGRVRALGLQPWEDPHNADPAYARARVRHQALPALEAALGPGVAEALARSAGQLRADAEALDELAARQAEQLRATTVPGEAPTALAALPDALGTGCSGRRPSRLAARPAR